MYIETTATRKLSKLENRIRGVAGGTSASKTISILMLLIDYAQSVENELISVVSETFPHLKRGAIRDFLHIMESHNYFNPKSWDKTFSTYTFETNTKLEFFSADQPGKVRGPRRDVLFVNEANNISYETYTQLEIRTRKLIWLDWNPVSEFWWYQDEEGGPGVKDRPDADFITLTYRDNEGLEKEVVDALELRRGNKNWWRVYGEGLLGEIEGLIYTDWRLVDKIPHEARLSKYGLDFGYTNDPAACLAVYEYDGGYILDEVFYRKGMSNKEIADLLKTQPRAYVVADSAEPKSIDEIKSYGLTIVGTEKGRDSVLHGIQFVQDQRVSVTKRSLNIIKERRNYLWQTDRDGKIINEPGEIFNHLMDAVRYAIASGKRVNWKPNDPGGVKPYIPGTLV